MPLDDKETANVVINVAIMVATALTAWATVRQLGLYRRSLAVAAPTVSGGVDRRDKSGPHPMHVTLFVDQDHAKAWRLNSVTVWLPWLPLISEVASFGTDEYGGISQYKAKQWTRRLSYDPPVQQTGFLCSFKSPAILRLRCELTSRADPRVKSVCVVRIKTID